jgi:hypothetical protein
LFAAFGIRKFPEGNRFALIGSEEHGQACPERSRRDGRATFRRVLWASHL